MNIQAAGKKGLRPMNWYLYNSNTVETAYIVFILCEQSRL